MGRKPGGNTPVHELQRKPPNQKGCQDTHGSEQQTLNPELPQNRPFCRAQGKTGRNLRISAANAYQRQAGQVCARNQQYKAHRRHEDHRRRARLHGETLLQRDRIVRNLCTGIFLLQKARSQRL